MKRIWYSQNKKADFKRLSDLFSISPIIVRLMRNRGLIEDEQFKTYISGSRECLHDPFMMKGIDKAVELLDYKIKNNCSIRIIGDYDIDGVSASYILFSVLKSLGARVDVDIPHRILDGYGISKRLIDKALSDGIDTIITCDNGIAAVDTICYAQTHGMTIIVTDHHEPPFAYESTQKKQNENPADAVIDPKLDDSGYPFADICGAVVAFKLTMALLQQMMPDRIEEFYEKLMPFCATATVGDIMPLVDENRIIVKEGISFFAKTDNIGLRALVSAGDLNINSINCYHLGYIIGPAINAAGRLDTAMKAFELFIEQDKGKALLRALELRKYNEERKKISQEALDKAKKIVETEGVTPVLFVYIDGMHESVCGIVAGKLKETYNRPAFVMTDSKDCYKGSARSIESYSMYDKMSECAELFVKYGGHRQAAGFTIQKNDFNSVKEFLNSHCGLSDKDFVRKLTIDFELPLDYITKELVEQMQILEPYGACNPTPIFAARDVIVHSARLIGAKENVLSMDLEQNGKRFRAVAFNDIHEKYEFLKTRDLITIAYTPQINEYRNIVSIQLLIEDIMQ